MVSLNLSSTKGHSGIEASVQTRHTAAGQWRQNFRYKSVFRLVIGDGEAHFERHTFDNG
jgi:hypothetical protein